MLITHKLSIIAVLCSVLFSGCGINNIPTYDESVNDRWSEVQNQYQRRIDLIPNLIETVNGFANKDAEGLQQVIDARTEVMQTNVSPEILSNETMFEQFQTNQAALGRALSKLILEVEVEVENYPNLKSDKNFLQLQTQLQGIEKRISIARRDYIQAVKHYNTELRTIPGRWWRQFMYSEMRQKATFSTDPEDL